jgi:hypothetical protein
MYGAQIPRKSAVREDNMGNSADIDGILHRGSDVCRRSLLRCHSRIGDEPQVERSCEY